MGSRIERGPGPFEVPIPLWKINSSEEGNKLTRKTSFNRKALAVATAGILSAGLVTVLPVASATASASSRPLIMESSPESTITQDFNPFVPTAAP